MSQFFQGLVEGLHEGRTARVAIPLAQDEACAYAVCTGVRKGLLSAVLIGDVAEITKMYAEIATHEGVQIVAETNADAACRKAVALVREGAADLLMKGLVPTSTILKAVLNSKEGLKKNPLLSHLAFFEHPSHPGMKILSDAAINIAPDVEALEKIARNAIEAFRLFTDRPPKVALLSANEKVSDKVPSTGLAKETAARFADPQEAVVEGPISLDLAIHPESGRIKKYGGKIQGDADIFIAPRIEVGNVLYKSLQYFAQAEMGGVVFGAQCPVVLTSRSDSNETKFNSLMLGVRLWRNASRSEAATKTQAAGA